MTKYLKGCRIVGLAGLVCFALSGLPAAPAPATVTCPPATTNPYCTTVVTVTVTITTQNGIATLQVTDPHLKVILLQKHAAALTLFDGDAGGVTIQVPGFKAGHTSLNRPK